MKKLILAAFALTTAVSVFAQGTVTFANRFTSPVATTLHVWGPSATAPSLSLIGLGSNDTPSGTTPFAASGMSLISGTVATGPYGFRTTFAQLLGANGSNQTEASLRPVGQTTTFRSGATAGGFIAQITSTLTGASPIDSAAAFATFEIAAWDNSSGQYSNWDAAFGPWQLGLIAAGHSAPFNVSAIGGGLSTPPNLNNMSPMGGSFNLYFIPEPSTFALAGLGAAALLIFRRRK